MTLINEARIEYDIAQAVSHSQKSDRNLWRAAFYAYRVVGSYIPEATRSIADLAGKNPATVENWAHAYEMFLEIFGVNSELAKNYRRTLTVSHLAKMWEEKRRFAIPLPASELYLAQMVTYKAQNQPHSVVALEREIRSDYHSNDDRIITWVSQRDTFRSKLKSALLWRDVPSGVERLVIELLKQLERE
jgi:hypothetical protein